MVKTKLARIRRIVAVLVAAVAFCLFLYFNPASWQNLFEITVDPDEVALKETQTEATSFLAKDVLENLAVKEKDNSQKYYRKLFYDDWSIVSDGCNIREAILKRDLHDIELKGCKVQSGILDDPYTGQQISFIRGENTSSAVQIDHVVALSNAWSTGALYFDKDTRYKISQDPVSLETPIGEEDDSHLGDFIKDERNVSPEEYATNELLKDEIAEVLQTLTEREEKVIRLRFGLEDGKPRTLEEVGQMFGVTRERIRQIEAKALRKLRHPSRAKKLKDFLSD